MAINSYASLKTAIENWTHRTDLTSVLDDFIALAESRLNSDLRTTWQETSETLTASPLMAIPSDCIAIRTITSNSSPVTAMQYIAPEMMDVIDQNDSGVAGYYTIIDNQIKVYPSPTSDIDIVYYARIPALKSTNTSNWLLEMMPDIYFNACLLEAFNYIRDDAQSTKYAMLYAESLARLRRMDSGRKHSQSMRVRAA